MNMAFFQPTIGATVIAVWTIQEEDGETVFDHAYINHTEGNRRTCV